MPTNLVRIHAEKCPQNSLRIHAEICPQISVRIHVPFWVVSVAHKFSKYAGKFPLFPVRIHVQFCLALDAHQFSKELQQTFCELPIKQFCLIGVGYVSISDLFQGPKSEIKSISVTQIMLQNSVRIQATKFNKTVKKRFSSTSGRKDT